MDSLMKLQKLLKAILFSLILLFSNSCYRLYTGSYSQPNFSPTEQPNYLGEKVEIWEDAKRTSGKSGEFEWWYFDAKLEDGSLFVCYFWKVHHLVDQYFIGMNYNPKNGDEIFLLKYFSKSQVSFSSESCNVIMGDNYFRGDLNEYEIFLSPDDFEGFSISLNLSSRLKPYRPQDGIIKAGDDYFAWLAAVPDGAVTGNIIINQSVINFKGDGYHDHNWGNTPLQKLFDGWVWFRGKAGPYTIIASELFTSDKRGGFDIPILYVANKEGVIINQFGNEGAFTKYSNRINNLYNKKNEPFFSNFDLMTENGDKISISGQNVIDNADLFSRMKLLKPLAWILKQSAKQVLIDPHYTRFDSELEIQLDSLTKKGYGVLEIMDLK